MIDVIEFVIGLRFVQVLEFFWIFWEGIGIRDIVKKIFDQGFMSLVDLDCVEHVPVVPGEFGVL
jgi:hypothetical protein